MPETNMENSPQKYPWLNHKVLYAVIAGLLIVLVGVSVAFYNQQKQIAQDLNQAVPNTPTQSADATADWKTYTNTQYGFEFKYPVDSLTMEKSSVFPIFVSSDRKIELSFSTTLPTGIQEIKTTSSYALYSVLNIYEGGLTGTRNAIFKINSSVYLVYAYPVSTENQSLSVFDQILSTFKFIDSADTSTWKTYTNTQYGYSFKYPETWAKVVDSRSSFSDYLSANGTRSFVAIYPTTYPAQDYSGRVDVYSALKSTVLKDDPYIKNETKIGDTVIGGTTWTKFSTPNGFDYFTELNSKTYEVSGTKDITDQILSTFKFTK